MNKYLKYLDNLRFVGYIGFILSFTIASHNKTLAFVATILAVVTIERMIAVLDQIKRIDKALNEYVMFARTIEFSNQKYEFIGHIKLQEIKKMKGYCDIEDADIQIIKTINGVDYVGYYKKVSD